MIFIEKYKDRPFDCHIGYVMNAVRQTNIAFAKVDRGTKLGLD